MGAPANTDVCNSALIKIGADPITLITDNVKAAILCNVRYTGIVKEVLRSHPWNCAKQRVTLSASVTVPTYDYSTQFPLPNDYIKWVAFKEFGSLDGFKIENGNVLCNSDTVNMLYIFNNQDTTTWDDLLVETVAWRLACDLAYPLIQSAALLKECGDMYKYTLGLARSMNGQEQGSIEQIVADTWFNSRYGGGQQGPIMPTGGSI